MKKCILFDCDGTLVDSERLCNVALVVKLRDFRIELDADELVIRFRGWKLARILDVLSREHNLLLPENFVADYRQLVSQLFENELKPIEGIHAALDKLDQAKAVVSSGPLPKIKQALRVCGLERYFGGNIYSSYEVGIWKPDPGIYAYAAKDMGYSVNDCVVVDDGPVGIEAGLKAGIHTLFYNRFNEACEFEGAVSFHSMIELPPLVMGDNA
jgi:HAD superfamily hydrolase (TIGR01509 family)